MGNADGSWFLQEVGDDVAGTAGVTVSETALTVTEEDATGDTYTVVLDSAPTANVVVTVGGHSGTDVTPTPATLTFTNLNWETARTVTVTAGNDADTANDTVSLTHSAASTDSDYSGISIAGVTVTVNDNDTGQVTGVTVEPGDTELVVEWTAVGNATGYKVQWKSGGQSYNTSDPAGHDRFGFDDELHDREPYQRHGIHGAGYRDPDGRQRRPAVGGDDGHAGCAGYGGRHGVGDGADGDGGGRDGGRLHGGSRQRADG